MTLRSLAAVATCLTLVACSHIALPQLTRQPVVGTVEYDTGLTRFSTVTGIYHQDMCSKINGDAQVHLSDREMKAILARAESSGFYRVRPDLGTNWPDPAARPAHCASFRLHVESGSAHNEVHWDCGPDGSNAPPAEVAPMVELIQQILRSKPEVKAMPWSRCG